MTTTYDASTSPPSRSCSGVVVASSSSAKQSPSVTSSGSGLSPAYIAARPSASAASSTVGAGGGRRLSEDGAAGQHEPDQQAGQQQPHAGSLPLGSDAWTSPRPHAPPTCASGWPRSWPSTSNRSRRATTATSPQARLAGTQWTPLPVIEELKAKARAQGLWNLFLPKEHAGEYAAAYGTDGGEGLTNVDYAPLAELMGRSAIAPLVFNCNAPDTGNMEVLLRYGTQEQRDTWLDPLLDGRIRSAFTMTEPDVATSDATNMAATAVVDGDEVVINGRKWWSTGVGHPDCRIYVFMGLTDPDADRHHRHTMVLVPRDAPGVKVERLLTTMGYADEPIGHGEVVLHRRPGPGRRTSSPGPARRSRSRRAGSAPAGSTTACG